MDVEQIANRPKSIMLRALRLEKLVIISATMAIQNVVQLMATQRGTSCPRELCADGASVFEVLKKFMTRACLVVISFTLRSKCLEIYEQSVWKLLS